ncbi:MAG: mevalonate kinase, partial [Nitrosopumilaceae archaeon]
MKSIATAPAKVILLGEHFVVHGVRAILCTIDKRVTVSSRTLDDNIIKIKSKLGNLSTTLSKSVDEQNIPLKPFLHIAKKILEKFSTSVGIEIDIKSDIPIGVGLGSSSACCVAAAASVSGIFGKLTREEILKLAIEAERTIFQKTSGADCSVCTYGGLMEYSTEQGYRALNSKIDFNLVIANSKETHSTNQIVHKVQNFKDRHEEIFLSLCNEENVIVEKALTAIKENDLPTLGKLMSENQVLLDKIGVTTEKLKVLVKTASNTSYGAKITGAGGGGCVIGLTDRTNLEQTLGSLEDQDCECFVSKIDYNGL